MKHKYVFSKDTAAGELAIKEYAELNKDIFAPVCETVYDMKQFESALSRGPEALMAEMRTPNFYPPSSFSERIVMGITEVMSSGDREMLEIFCDDADFLTRSVEGHEEFETIDDEEDDETLDEFIGEDLPDSFGGDDAKNGSAEASDPDSEDDSPDDEEE